MENTKPPIKDKETKESLEQLIEYFGDTIISDWTSNENGIKEADSLRVKRELIDFISQELDKAREEGVKDCIRAFEKSTSQADMIKRWEKILGEEINVISKLNKEE